MCDEMKLHGLTILLIAIGVVLLLAIPAHTTGSEQVARQRQEILVVRAVPTIYPLLAAVAEESGTVVVEVKIKSDGTVAEVSSVEGHKLFRVVAEKSAFQWAFNPIAEQNAFRVARLTFSFRLFPKTADAETLLPVFMPPYSVEIRGKIPDHSYSKEVDPPMRTKPNNRRSK